MPNLQYIMTFSPYPSYNSVALNGDFVYTVRIATTDAVGGTAQIIVAGFLTPGEDQV